MCGIAGYIGPSESAHSVLPPSLDLIAHRGPDAKGAERHRDVTLGMTRLSIIDLAGGAQPMFNPDRTLSVVFNGEIYNYRELRHDLAASGHTFRTRSDTEVLLHLYEEHGEAMCHLLRGMFAFAIHDRSRGLVFLARDRFGKKPLFLRCTGAHVWFGSELKVIVAASRATKTLRVADQSVYDYLTFGCVPQPSTIYEDVTMVPAGHHAVLADHSPPRLRPYWVPDMTPRSDLEPSDAVEELRRLMAEAVSLRLRSDVPLGVFLSGGIDSSVVATEAARELGPSLRTFTVSTDDPALDEADVAARTAQRLGVRHDILRLTLNVEEAVQRVASHYDQPFADSSAIPSMQIARLARDHVKVILNGDGGDELFGGYRRHVAARQLDRIGQVRQLAGPLSRVARNWHPPRRSRRGMALRLVRGLGADPQSRYLIYAHNLMQESDRQEMWRGLPRVLASERHLSDQDRISALTTQMSDDIRVNLTSGLLVKMDMACMASSVEGRSPFMDSELAAFALTLPDDLKVRGGTGKWLLRQAYRAELSEEVVAGPKKGFEVPLQRWMTNELRPLAADTVLRADAYVGAYLDLPYIAKIFGGTALADRNLPTMQYAILMLELWLRQANSNGHAP